MEIPKAASVPLDAQLPSFLTLPSEIRNQIYELLFLRDGPVYVHSLRAYHAGKPTESELDEYSMNETFRQDQDYDARLDAGIPRVPEDRDDLKLFDHGLWRSLGLLKSCRQIYHEGVGVIYKNNSFVISCTQPAHASSGYYASSLDKDYCPLHYAPTWLKSLGMQYRHLKDVRIDLSVRCGGSCGHAFGDDTFDLLPILRVVWQHPQTPCNITFIHADHHFDKAHNVDTRYQKEGDISAWTEALSKVMVSL